MAGRGTDIKLGDGVVSCDKCCLFCEDEDCGHCSHERKLECFQDTPCGLYIIGTERHEARRIDNQLRGRSGRQGDPGFSKFFLSLEDDLMRLFGSERVAAIMDRFGAKENEPMTHPLVTRAIANAQKRVELNNFEIRKHLLEYDNVMNRQREVIYKMRDEILLGEKLKERAYSFFEETIEDILLKYSDPKKYAEEWDWEGIKGEFGLAFLVDFNVPKDEIVKFKQDTLLDKLLEIARQRLDEREQTLGQELFGELLKFVMLGTIDSHWRDHLYALDALREGIGLRAYGQKDPLIEYKQESFRMFDEVLRNLAKDISSLIFRAQLRPEVHRPVRTTEYKPVVAGGSQSAASASGHAKPRQAEPEKIGRNDPCPCGSGKKYKKCCGKSA